MGRRLVPASDVTPQQVYDAIGENLLAELDARDIELHDSTPDHRITRVIFQLGTSGQWIGVCAHNLWRGSSDVIGARKDEHGGWTASGPASEYEPATFVTAGFDSLRLDEIPAAIRSVVDRRAEW